MQIGIILTQKANVERLMKKQLRMQEAFDLVGNRRGYARKDHKKNYE